MWKLGGDVREGVGWRELFVSCTPVADVRSDEDECLPKTTRSRNLTTPEKKRKKYDNDTSNRSDGNIEQPSEKLI